MFRFEGDTLPVEDERPNAMIRKNRWKGLAIFLFLELALGIITAEAHVDILPMESRPNRWEVYALTVPTESSSPTVQISMNVPWGFEVEAIEHRPPWKFSAERDAAGLIRDIIWTGREIPPLTFEEFKFFAKAPKEKGSFSWTVYQKYADGKESTWNFQTFVKEKEAATARAAGGEVMGPPSALAETSSLQKKTTKEESGSGNEALQRAKEAITLSYVALGISIVLVVATFVILWQNPGNS